jgi:putative oxidoreductase
MTNGRAKGSLFEDACLLLGRFLLGIYFILPGISKITGYEGTVEYMTRQQVPLIDLLLPLTIVLQIGLGLALIVGYRGQVAAFLLAGLTLVINFYMHNFWALEDGVQQRHETQNFFKNLGIMAGLLVMAGLGTGRYSLQR